MRCVCRRNRVVAGISKMYRNTLKPVPSISTYSEWLVHAWMVDTELNAVGWRQGSR